MADREGRPSEYRDEFAGQAEKLCELGATDSEIADFFAQAPSEDEWLSVCLRLIRQDRNGKAKARSEKRSARRRGNESASIRLQNATRARIWSALRGRSDGALFSRLGYSLKDLMWALERKFQKGMGWENYGRWHVDHIKPCAMFDQTDPEQFRSCWSLANLQPLWAGDNIRKGAKYARS